MGLKTTIRTLISSQRKEELAIISKILCDSFAKVLDVAAREDDCIELLHTALSSMGYTEQLFFTRKADWRESLKPHVQRLPISFQAFMGDVQHDAAINSSTVLPRKRRETAGKVPSNIAGKNSMDLDKKAVPRPPLSDNNSLFIKTLESYDINNTMTNFLLECLQQTTKRRSPDLPPEPLLCSEPTQCGLNVHSPFLIIEGESYATGKPVYEAQNEAAVLALAPLKSCMILLS